MAPFKKLLAISILVASCGAAAPLCTSVVTTAADFQAQGNIGCQFGDKIFYDFTYSYTLQDSNGNALIPNVPALSVLVQFSNYAGNPTMPVLTFLANWDVINGDQGDIRINYNVSAPPTGAMFASNMILSGYVSNVDPANQFNSYISGAEGICCPGPGNTSVGLGVELDPPTTTSGLVFVTGSDSKTYAPTTQISVSKDIFLSSGSNSGVPGGPPNGNEAKLVQIDQGLYELTSVPEPMSFMLLGGGLMALSFLSRRGGKLNSTRRSS